MVNRSKTPADADLTENQKWGVPNWKKSEQYPDWEQLNIHQQRWEFLRRTKEYRSDWDRMQRSEEVHTSSKFVSPFSEKRLKRKYNISHAISPTVNYKELPIDFIFIKEECIHGGHVVYPRAPVPKPLTKEQEKTLSWDEKLHIYAQISAVKPQVPDIYDLRVWVEFDLTYSLDEQINHARDNLKKAKDEADQFMEGLKNKDNVYDPYDYAPKERGKKKPKVPTGSPYPTLLRILDAKNAGQKNEKISSVFSQQDMADYDASTISKKYKLAQKIWSII